MSRSARADFGWFALWAGVGAASLFSFLELGVFGVPILLVPFGFAVRKAPRVWPEILGATEGWAVICLLLAFLNRQYRPCGTAPIRLSAGQSYSCGGTPPVPWLIAGALLASIGLIAYLLAVRLRSPGRVAVQ